MWPVIERELRVALRRKAPRGRWLIALGAGAVSSFFLLVAAVGGTTRLEFFRVLLWIGLYVCVAQVVQAAADSFSEERRNQTLGLLFLAGLSPMEIFISKLAGSFVRVFNNLLALLPFLSLPFLSGGVSLACFIAANVLLLNLLFFTFAVTTLASVLCHDDGAAVSLTVLIGGLLSFGAAAVWYLVNYFSDHTLTATWLLFSPAYAARLVFIGLPLGTGGAFYHATAVTLGYTLLSLTAAGAILSCTWRNQSGVLAFSSGRSPVRTSKAFALRRRWLEERPFGWIIVRDNTVLKIAAAVLAAFGALWMFCAVLWPLRWATPINALATCALINSSVIAVVALAAARRLGEDRRNGALEILLTTPLSVPEIVGDYHAALREQFRPFARWVWIGNAALAIAPLVSRAWTAIAFATYAIAWLLVVAITLRPMFSAVPMSMWVSLNTGRPVYSALKPLNLGWPWIWIAYNFFSGAKFLRSFPTGSVAELVVAAFLAVVAIILLAAVTDGQSSAQLLLTKYFRQICAMPPPPPSDPSLKNWDASQPLPAYRSVGEPT